MPEEHFIEALKEAREQLVIERRSCVQRVAHDHEARAMFKSLEDAIAAIDRAIRDEKRIGKAQRSEEAINELHARSKLLHSITAPEPGVRDE